MTRVVGPQPDDGGKYWIIDGRDEEVPGGTAPRLRNEPVFQLSSETGPLVVTGI